MEDQLEQARLERLRVAVRAEDAAQAELVEAMRAMMRAGLTWDVERTEAAWSKFQARSDTWNRAMTRFRQLRRRADRLRIAEGETGQEDGS